MPGRSYSAEQKISAGEALDKLGVSFIQAGFPIIGEKDQTVISELAKNSDADIVGLARAVPTDVEAALAADSDVVEVFVSLSDLYLEYALGKSRSEVLEMLEEAVNMARDGGTTVHISLADAFRTDQTHLFDVFRLFPDASYINLADTVGARTPTSVQTFLERLSDEIDLDRVGVHFHDDLGVATANALTAYEAGVGKVDVSVASLGERAGNPALEEVVVAGQTEYNDDFGVQTSELVPSCTQVLNILDETVQSRKAILGAEVTEHESGIHTTAMLDEPRVFEPFAPAEFGGRRRLLFGAGTGKSGARKLLDRAGIEPTAETVAEYLEILNDNGPVETDEAISLAQQRFN